MGQSCTHSGATEVLRIGKCRIVAGSAMDINDALDDIKPDYLLSVGGRDLAATAKEPMVSFDAVSSRVFKNTRAMTPDRWKPKGSIIVDWPDMGVPPMDEAWWDALIDDLEQIDGTVAVFCFGGHGRTGTTLAILAGKTLDFNGDDPVDWLRDFYCKDCVETAAQIKYVNDMGVVTSAKPSKVFPSVTYAGNHYGGTALDDFGIGLAASGEDFGAGVPCDVCDEEGARYNKVEGMWLCKECARCKEFSDVPTPVDDEGELECIECHTKPAAMHPIFKQPFCDRCYPDEA